MTLLVKEREPRISASAHSNSETGATRRFMESMARREKEYEKRKRELQKIKANLPEDKERLDIDRLDNRLSGLYEFIKAPKMTELFELEYYLDRPEIKTTDEFVDFIIKTRGQA